MTEITRPRESERRTGFRIFSIWLVVILVLVTVSSISIAAVVDKTRIPSSAELAFKQAQAQDQLRRELALARPRLIGALAWQWIKNVLIVIVPLAAVALGTWAGMRKLSVIPADRAGGYPLLVLPWLEIHWPRRYVDETGQVRWLPVFRYRARLIDPNRNPTVGIELGSKVEFIQPDRVADTQMQITTQAQAVQAERARASGNVTVAGNRGSSSRLLDGGTTTVIYPRALPEPARMPVDTDQVQQVISGEAHVIEAS